ncbi:MAG: tetratricopeptide repeat protein [Nitrospinae bacterium]|nr:tetratricopeptide repeat protein [Nitrospinota bacterium]
MDGAQFSGISGISFCVITGGHRPDRMEALIASIARMNIPQFEILVCGNYHEEPRISYAEKKEWAAKAEVCKMRNFNAARARFDTIVILDDDVTFAPDWWENIKHIGPFDLAGCRGLDPHGNRWWDYQRIERGNPLAVPVLLDYAETHPDAYISGYFMLMRKAVWDAVKFDEQRRNYQHDDIDFCHRASAMGFTLALFPQAAVTHHVDPRGREENDRAKAEFIARHGLDSADEGTLAEAYLRMKEYARAIPVLKKLAAEKGGFHNFYNLAFCYEQAGAEEDALYCYRKALDAQGAEPHRFAAAHYHIAYILRARGNTTEAEEHFKAALAHQPEHRMAALALDERKKAAAR